MIYLASPYAHKDPAMMEFRFAKTCQKAGELMKENVVVYSPIAHNHPIASRTELPRTWDYWKKFDLHILKMCEKMLVYRLPGWQESVGVQAEIDFCLENDISIDYID